MVRADGRQLLPGAEHRLRPRRSSRSTTAGPRKARSGCARRCPSRFRSAAGSCLNTYWHLVRGLVAQDRLDDAREIAAFAARGVPEEDPHSSAWLSLTEAWVATAAGERRRPRRAFAEAVRLFEELDYPLDLAEARFALARSLLSVRRGGRRQNRARASALDLRPHRRRRPPRRGRRRARGAGRGAGSRRLSSGYNGPAKRLT